MADQLEEAIKAKDPVKIRNRFRQADRLMQRLPRGFGFIKMREPKLSPIETSPLTDEDFSGK